MIRQTSVDAYHAIRDEGLISKRKFEVYEILFHHGPLTAHEIVYMARSKYPLANQTGFNARLSELKTLGLAIEVGEKINPVSGKLNYLWDVTDKRPVNFEKPHREKCKTCGGKGYIETVQAKFNLDV